MTVFATPAVVVVPGPQLPGQTGVQSFRLTNTSSCATWFTFSEPVFVNGPLSAFPDVGDGDDTPRDSRLPALSLSPDCGSIPAGGSVLINALFTALSAEACVRGQYAINVTAGLYYSSRPQPEEAPAHTVSVRVCATTRLGEVMIVEPEVDLGLSAIDKTVKRAVHVRNITNAAVRWTMSQPAWEAVHPAGSAAAAAGRGVAITFEPSSGLLGPNESVAVALSCLVRGCVCVCLCLVHA